MQGGCTNMSHRLTNRGLASYLRAHSEMLVRQRLWHGAAICE